MSEENNLPEEQTEEKNVNFMWLIIAITCFSVGVVLFIVSFFVKGGIYLLISSMISELAAVTFLNAQKRVYENVVCKVFKYLSYAVMIAGLAVFIIGTGVATAASKQ